MSSPGGWKRFFRLGHSRDRVEEQVEDELRFHMEGLVDRYVRNGMSVEEAWERVQAECGSLDAARGSLARSAWKSWKRARRRETVDSLFQDVRTTLRQIRKRPVFAAVVILTLGLGIGANSAVFSVLRSVVLTPLPYPDPDRIMTVWTPWEGDRFNPLSYLDWVDLRDGSDSFEDWGLWESASLNLSGDGDPIQVSGIRTSTEVFRALGATAARGRLFLSEDTDIPVSRVAVLGHGFWERRFGSDPEILGRDILINREPWTVVGVLDEDFRFPDWGALTQPDLFLPLSIEPAHIERGTYYLRVIGRLRADRSREQAHEELNVIAARLAEEYPETNAHRVAQVVPISEIVLGESPVRLWILLGVTGFVLLLACANVGGLLMARNLGRSTEMAVRRSLGAGRGRLARQLLTETMVLGFLGGGVGLLLAWLGTDLLVRILPPSVLVGTAIGVDGLVVSVTLGATLLTGLLVGVAPALGTPMEESAAVMRTGSRTLTHGKTRGRLLGTMVVVQFALAFVLVDGAGLMLQSLKEATTYRELEDPGQVLVAGYLHPVERGDEIAIPDPFVTELLRRVRGLPGVREAGAAATLPFQGYWTSDLLAEGQEYSHDSEVPSTHMVPASPGYLAAMGIELVQGRDLAPEDLTEGVLGVVATEAFARQRWPGESALGKRIWANMPSDPWLEAVVVGVAKDVRQYGLETTAIPGLYLPFFPPFLPNRWVAMRVAGDPLALAPEVRRIMAELDPHRPITQTFTAEALYESGARSRTATARYFGIFALIAMALAAAGTFGVMSFFVGQKMRELGIRVALGAGRRSVVWLVLRTGLALAAAGTVIGLLGVLAVSGVLSNLLYGVGALSPVFLLASALGLGLVALGTSGIPAARAGRADPVEVIRAE